MPCGDTFKGGKICLIFIGLYFIHSTVPIYWVPMLWRKRAYMTALWKARYFLGHALVLVLSKKLSTSGFWEALAHVHSSSSLALSALLYASSLLQVTVPLISPLFFLQRHTLIELFQSSKDNYSPYFCSSKFCTSILWGRESPQENFYLPSKEWNGQGQSVISEFIY